MNNQQRTIGTVVEYSGVGLFTGEKTKLCFKPSPEDTGVSFVRSDVEGRPLISATTESVSDCKLNISLRKDGVGVKSIEHVMAALAGLGIDNIEIELSGNEVPAGDGSSLLFSRLLKEAGVVHLEKPKRDLFLQSKLEVRDGDASIVALPWGKGLSLSYILDFNGSFLNRQCFEIELTEQNFFTQIAPARTFGLSTAVEEFRRLGLGKGITDDNTFVLQEDGTITKPLSMVPATLRFPDECARHKILDIIGDLYLTNLVLHARIIATKSGHSLNARMAKKIIEISKNQTNN
ncbi:MAG: UDP-3-O-acyl-N-acetylglucosamine deacetylase [Candidatus Scalindua sp.]|nr:UDP-3-O-[3-hydroxymyristoyl] N-acetylglucosamine deacetylase [Planctomycetota bacterium]GJQ59347.1 MAG: UDP-3-O-acyl-N-acetylglucosamine deacetylase [Candidatus Scalindua sp.]